MFYPAKFLTHLVSRLPDGGTDELRHEENVMISLRDDGTWALRYNDPENGGQTMLQGTEHHLSVSRSGHIVSRLLFRVGERCESVYRTPTANSKCRPSPRSTTHRWTINAAPSSCTTISFSMVRSPHTTNSPQLGNALRVPTVAQTLFS